MHLFIKFSWQQELLRANESFSSTMRYEDKVLDRLCDAQVPRFQRAVQKLALLGGNVGEVAVLAERQKIFSEILYPGIESFGVVCVPSTRLMLTNLAFSMASRHAKYQYF